MDEHLINRCVCARACVRACVCVCGSGGGTTCVYMYVRKACLYVCRTCMRQMYIYINKQSPNGNKHFTRLNTNRRQ